MAILCGYQAILFAIFAKVFAISERLLPPDEFFKRAFKKVTLESGLLAGAVACLAGLSLLLASFLKWKAVGFGDLSYATTMRSVIPGASLTMLGFETILASFFLSMLGMRRI